VGWTRQEPAPRGLRPERPPQPSQTSARPTGPEVRVPSPGRPAGRGAGRTDIAARLPLPPAGLASRRRPPRRRAPPRAGRPPATRTARGAVGPHRQYRCDGTTPLRGPPSCAHRPTGPLSHALGQRPQQERGPGGAGQPIGPARLRPRTPPLAGAWQERAGEPPSSPPQTARPAWPRPPLSRHLHGPAGDETKNVSRETIRATTAILSRCLTRNNTDHLWSIPEKCFT